MQLLKLGLNTTLRVIPEPDLFHPVCFAAKNEENPPSAAVPACLQVCSNSSEGLGLAGYLKGGSTSDLLKRAIREAIIKHVEEKKVIRSSQHAFTQGKIMPDQSDTFLR